MPRYELGCAGSFSIEKLGRSGTFSRGKSATPIEGRHVSPKYGTETSSVGAPSGIKNGTHIMPNMFRPQPQGRAISYKPAVWKPFTPTQRFSHLRLPQWSVSRAVPHTLVSRAVVSPNTGNGGLLLVDQEVA